MLVILISLATIGVCVFCAVTSVAALLALCLCVGLCACRAVYQGSSSSQTKGKNNSYTSPTKKKLTISEKEEIAEEEALDAVYSSLKSKYGSKYDVGATKYKKGQITNSGNNFTVNGTLYLYDKYGSLEDTATFSVRITVDDDGSTSGGFPTINIK